jgi:hypothetical protein
MSVENTGVLDRDRLRRILRELRGVLDDLPADLKVQVAIRSAIAFIESAAGLGPGDERSTQV